MTDKPFSGGYAAPRVFSDTMMFAASAMSFRTRRNRTLTEDKEDNEQKVKRGGNEDRLGKGGTMDANGKPVSRALRSQMRYFAKSIIIIVVISCTCLAVSAEQQPVTDSSHDNRTVEILLFPINLAPDIVSNTLIYMLNPFVTPLAGKGVSNLWPIIYLVSPILGPVTGVVDAWYGYPPWDPVALDEHRRYRRGH